MLVLSVIVIGTLLAKSMPQNVVLLVLELPLDRVNVGLLQVFFGRSDEAWDQGGVLVGVRTIRHVETFVPVNGRQAILHQARSL